MTALEAAEAATAPSPTTSTSSAPIPTSKDAPAASETQVKPNLPPLSPAEFRAYNRLAEHMDLFHNHFRQTWNTLYNAASTGRRPAAMSLKAFINEGLSFISHLETHHSIEETYIFPVLARKMPEFKAGKGNGAAELLRQHREIHKGMDELQDYLMKCRSGELDLEIAALKARLDTWGTVLWTHLDQEVKTLGAENMRQYWTIEEINRIPM
ncbi:Uu.00g079100.m01.CDS01 [Anthostomella pinea]|uniref:Uu.00g079100.m01.CDS01 n=1 Tax=Anthostomella pinea TaxID=933095 RepID=A0AAI8VKR3_9PEZI|nr:Uu.00g079100.m01.CDS01 [Anthostomella pinea]